MSDLELLPSYDFFLHSSKWTQEPMCMRELLNQLIKGSEFLRYNCNFFMVLVTILGAGQWSMTDHIICSVLL